MFRWKFADSVGREVIVETNGDDEELAAMLAADKFDWPSADFSVMCVEKTSGPKTAASGAGIVNRAINRMKYHALATREAPRHE